MGEVFDGQQAVSQIDVEQLLAGCAGQELVHGFELKCQCPVCLREMGLQSGFEQERVFDMVACQSAQRTVGYNVRQLDQLVHGIGIRPFHVRHVQDRE